MARKKLDVTFPIIIGTDLYPMEHLGGVRSEDGKASRGQAIRLDECKVVSGERIRSVAGNGFLAWRYSGVHARWGRVSYTSLDVSYVETYRHIADQGPFPLEALKDRGGDAWRAVVAHVEVAPAAQIQPKDLASALRRARPGDAIIVDAAQYTDRCLQRGNGVIDFNDYNLQSPFFSAEAMRAMIDAGVTMIAGNFPSFSDPEGGTGVAMLKLFWGAPGNLIAAPLLRLGEVAADVTTLRLNPLPITYAASGHPICPTVE